MKGVPLLALFVSVFFFSPVAAPLDGDTQGSP